MQLFWYWSAHIKNYVVSAIEMNICLLSVFMLTVADIKVLPTYTVDVTYMSSVVYCVMIYL
jgi:hypothetical protein